MLVYYNFHPYFNSIHNHIIENALGIIEGEKIMNIRNVRVPRRDDYEKRPVLSATIHPDIKRTLLGISERTGMSVSQVSDEVLYTGLIEMQELPELVE